MADDLHFERKRRLSECRPWLGSTTRGLQRLQIAAVSPYLLGEIAFHTGGDCPYEDGSDEARAWRQGRRAEKRFRDRIRQERADRLADRETCPFDIPAGHLEGCGCPGLCNCDGSWDYEYGDD